MLVQTVSMLQVLAVFEEGLGRQLELRDRYLSVLLHYGREMDAVRKTFLRHRDNPPIPRNAPPVSLSVCLSALLLKISHKCITYSYTVYS